MSHQLQRAARLEPARRPAARLRACPAARAMPLHRL
jgi:hypothetical protein